jgi:ABC-2 type transport system permease protein
MLPAIAMKAYADEKRLRTWDLLQSRPFTGRSIFLAKFFSVWLFSLVCILSTLVSVLSIWQLGFPKGNLDLGQVVAGYFSLILLSAVYSSIGLFASSQTSNGVAAFVLAASINFVVFYGFNLLSGLFLSGASQMGIADIGLSNHFEETNKGVLHLHSLLLFVLYFSVFSFLTVRMSTKDRQPNRKGFFVVPIILVSLIIGNQLIPDISKDLTSDRRYTFSDYSQKVLSDLKKSDKRFEINLYLEGDLNRSFVRLRKQIDHLLNDANRQSGYRFKVNYINPLQNNSVEKVNRQMTDRGMRGIMLNEADRNGKVSRQLIFPYLEIIEGHDTLPVNVLKNIPGNTAEDNLKASAENLEYELIDALVVLTDKVSRNIAFIEGHDELPRPYLYDAEEALAKYYSINRGEIVNDFTALDPFKVVVIAGPTKKYTEQQKYILDQYIMRGGRVLWLLDGVYFSEEQLAMKGRSVTVKNQASLDDLLFTYGVRVNPVLVQDEQCASLLVSSGKEDKLQSSVIPWYFCPLLIPSPDNPITKDIALVKAPYVSSIDLIRQPDVEAKILLTTSGKSHLVKATEEVNFDAENIPNAQNYFNQKFLIASVAIEGKFTSAYVNRMVVDSIQNIRQPKLDKSLHSKMVVMSSSSIIRNELAGQEDKTQVVPLGFDRTSGRQFGNKDFIVNAVNWLANDDNLLLLRKKQQQLRLLDKTEIEKNRNVYVAANMILPVLFLGGYIGMAFFRRKKKYESGGKH